MYGSERHVLLRHYLEAGLTKAAIAQRLGLDRSTIHRWLRGGAGPRRRRRSGPLSAAAPAAE